MGGRKPTSPQIVPSQPPKGFDGRMFMGGSADFDERTGKYRSTGTRRPPQKQRRDIGVGGGPGIPPRFPDQVNDPRYKQRQRKPIRGRRPSFENLPPEQQKEIISRRNQQMKRRRRKAGRRMPPRGRPVTGPGFPSDGPSIMPIPPREGFREPDFMSGRPKPMPPKDDLGGPPEREVPIPKERLPRITRESDPRGSAPFAPDEKGMVRDRFFERMFEKADEVKQRKSMQKEERREVRQARNEERRARRMQPGEINVGNERREIGRSMIEERARRRMQPGEIDVGGEIDINAERGGRRRRRGGMRRNRRGRRRDFTRRRSRMEGGRRGRSREERAAFRDRYVSTMGGGFF